MVIWIPKIWYMHEKIRINEEIAIFVFGDFFLILLTIVWQFVIESILFVRSFVLAWHIMISDYLSIVDIA